MQGVRLTLDDNVPNRGPAALRLSRVVVALQACWGNRVASRGDGRREAGRFWQDAGVGEENGANQLGAAPPRGAQTKAVWLALQLGSAATCSGDKVPLSSALTVGSVTRSPLLPANRSASGAIGRASA